MPVPGVEHGIRVSDGAHGDSGTLLRIARNGYALEAKVFRDGREITAERPASAFTWTRSSSDAAADAAWNAAHAGMKQISFSEAEIAGGARYNCIYAENQGQYGTMTVRNDYMVVHTQATADATHTFSLIEGKLWVDIPNNVGNGTEYQLTNGVLTVNPGFTGTITAEYEFTPSPTREIDFEYDHNGLRTQKRIVENGVTTTYDYTLHGKLITHMTKTTVETNGAETKQELHFFYDAQSRPAYVEYGNMKYYYIYNFQGDVLALLDANNQFVVEYTYDIWGQPIRITGALKDTIGKANPFRYRSYPWDEETETYYLRNRFYFPKFARFIVSDRIPEYTGTETPFDRNQFSYCFNNPTDFIDPNGTFGFLASMLIGGIVNAVVGAVVDLVCGEDFSWAKAGKNFVKGAFIGGAGSMIQGASYAAKAANTVLGAVATAEVSFLEYSCECARGEREYSNAGLAVNMVYDTATSLMGPSSGFEVLDAVGDTVTGISTGVIKEGAVNPFVDKIVTPASKLTSSRANKSAPRRDSMPYLKMVYDPLLGKNREVICYS